MRQISVGESVGDAVTIGIERDADGREVASVWWPSKGGTDADEASFSSVPEALEAAQAAQTLHGFAEVVVVLASQNLWKAEWGYLQSGPALSDAEALELARATEASRDA